MCRGFAAERLLRLIICWWWVLLIDGRSLLIRRLVRCFVRTSHLHTRIRNSDNHASQQAPSCGRWGLAVWLAWTLITLMNEKHDNGTSKQDMKTDRQVNATNHPSRPQHMVESLTSTENHINLPHVPLIPIKTTQLCYLLMTNKLNVNVKVWVGLYRYSNLTVFTIVSFESPRPITRSL